ncbi:MAG: hypothetical protein E7596_00785 [Ruminococcaceae bacterium]|nr:hypothetical protein [Oscillospiraceae bacterium]
MKIGLFSDPHYCQCDNIGGNRHPMLSYDKIKTSMEEFNKSGVDLCICMGDLTDHAKGDTRADAKSNLKKIMALINSYKIPFYLVVGNHDYLMLNSDDLKEENIDTPPYKIETEEYNFIALDGNYRSDMERFDKAGVVWDDSNLPPFQLDYLRKSLASSQKPCIVLVHENLDPTVQEQHIIKNATEVRKIIKESGKVKMVIQGHFHEGSYQIIDGIPYLTLKAMCQGEENPYVILEI